MGLKIKTNLWTGIIMGLISGVFLLMLPGQVRTPAYNSGAPSPRIIPAIVLVGILICSVVLVVQSLVFKKEKIYVFDIKNELPAIILIGMLLAFTFIVIKLGFIAGVVVLFPAMLFYFGERKPFIYIFSLVCGIGIYYLFIYVFNITLPGFPGIGG